MEFRKMVTITLYARQQKKHRCIEQSFGLYGRGRGWDDWEKSIETCIISYKKKTNKKKNHLTINLEKFVTGPPHCQIYSSVQFSSVTQSCLTLQSFEPKHSRPPCPSPHPEFNLTNVH